MKGKTKSSLLGGALILGLFVAGLSAGQPLLSGVELEFWPHLRGASEGLPPEGFFVRLDTYPNFFPQHSFQAGRPFRPPGGRFAAFLEGDGWISPQVHVLNLPVARPLAEPTTKKVGLSVVRAGVVQLAPSVKVEEKQHLRILGLESHNKAEAPMVELCRRIFDIRAARAGIQMPAGMTLISVASADNSLQAISRPFKVEEGKAVVVEPLPPKANASVLFGVLEMPGILESFDQYGTSAVLVGSEGRRFEPEVVSPSSGRAYLVFYDLPPGEYSLELVSKLFDHPPVPVHLEGGGKIERATLRLQPRPNLKVRLDIPEELLGQRRLVALQGSTILREIQPRSGSQVLNWMSLPPEEIEVLLEVGPWQFRQPVDLRAGDQEIEIAPEPITVAGRVRMGDLALPATLSFSTDLRRQLPVETRTDDQGEYEILLWRWGTFLVKVLPTQSDSSWSVPIPKVVQIEETPWQRLDFDLPDNSFRVLVRRRDTKAPIANAEVTVGIEAARGGRSSQRGVATSDGEVRLPPLEEGYFQVTAKADGFSPASTPRQAVANTTELLVLELEPTGDAFEIRLALPGGSPAADAEARIVEASGELLWQGKADARGALALPERLLVPNRWLLARHALAGAFVQHIQSTGLTESAIQEERWNLPSAMPLELKLKSDSGGPWALALIAKGLRLIGPQAAWLLGVDAPVLRQGQAIYAKSFSEKIETLGALSMSASPSFLRGEIDAQLASTANPGPSFDLPTIH